MSETIKKGSVVIEGKTKIIHNIQDNDKWYLVESKDRITANTGMEGAKHHDLKGKAAVSTETTATIFEMLQDAGIDTHFVRRYDEKHFLVEKCEMIPIEFVTRRIATGSFLKRNAGVKEGYVFAPPKMEYFFKDDEQGDPQWSKEQIIASNWKFNGREITGAEVDMMSIATVCIFEILENAWKTVDCSLIDMKIEFGVNTEGQIVLADVIDSDSWRLWPSGDKRLMKDKQVYRNLDSVTDDGLATVMKNFQWVADKLKEISPKVTPRAVVFMGSPSDIEHCDKIKKSCHKFGIPCELRVSSAHKSTEETLQILAEYEGSSIPTVFIAVAGRSNGLGPVLAGNASWPVISCPPVKADWGSQDIWSSMRLPSGLGCTTILDAGEVGIAAAKIFALTNHRVWAKLRSAKLNQRINLRKADLSIQ